MGARPNVLSGVVNWPAATHGGAPFGAGAAQVAGSMPPGAPRPRAAPASTAAPVTAATAAATLDDRFAVIDALSDGLDGLSRNLRRLQADVRAARHATPEVRSEHAPNGTSNGTSNGTPNARGPARALRGGLGALGGAARSR